MSAAQQYFLSGTGSTNVIAFPASPSGSTEFPPDMGGFKVADDATDSQLKAWIDSAVMQAYLAVKADRLEEHDGPFDPIYIAALQPDPIDLAAVSQLHRFRHIEDKSDEIFLDDGLDE